MAVTAALSPGGLPQSSRGRFEVKRRITMSNSSSAGKLPVTAYAFFQIIEHRDAGTAVLPPSRRSDGRQVEIPRGNNCGAGQRRLSRAARPRCESWSGRRANGPPCGCSECQHEQSCASVFCRSADRETINGPGAVIDLGPFPRLRRFYAPQNTLDAYSESCAFVIRGFVRTANER